MRNPCLYDKSYIDKLCKMSIRCFGSKWRFRKLANRLALEAEEIEEQMQAIITYQEEQIERRRIQHDATKEPTETSSEEVRPEQTTDGPTTSGGDE